ESPSCGACTVAGFCVAKKKGLQDSLPLPEARREPVPVRWTCLRVVRDGKVLLWRRSEKERLLKNLWGFPEEGRVPATSGKKLAEVSHTITHHALTLVLREAELQAGATLPPEAKWVPRGELRDYLVSSLWLKLIAR